MGALSIRKVPGIGRVNERLLESVGVKVFIFLTLLCVRKWSSNFLHPDL